MMILSHRSRLVPATLAAVGGAVLTGCSMGDFSHPTLTVRNAAVTSNAAEFDVTIENPSDFDLTLTAIDYSVVYGPLPVADGVWRGRESLPSKGRLDMSLRTPFDSPPLDPSAEMIEFSGQMRLEDPGHSKEMALERAPFKEESPVRR